MINQVGSQPNVDMHWIMIIVIIMPCTLVMKIYDMKHVVDKCLLHDEIWYMYDDNMLLDICISLYCYDACYSTCQTVVWPILGSMFSGTATEWSKTMRMSWAEKEKYSASDNRWPALRGLSGGRLPGRACGVWRGLGTPGSSGRYRSGIRAVSMPSTHSLDQVAGTLELN